MPNPWFKFKQFTVFHDKTAMKVGTDGVLLGAWADCSKAKHILDVGTGTGLVALMLAQRGNAGIDAIEIDENAYLQAIENVKNSPWPDKITIHHCSFQDFVLNSSKKFDLIVSNPPYFVRSLKSPEQSRNLARHNNTLPYNDLIDGSTKLLNENGKLIVIIPFDNLELFIKTAFNKGLFCNNQLEIKPKPTKPAIRVILEFSKIVSPAIIKSLTIDNNERHCYTDEYKELTKDFYLGF